MYCNSHGGKHRKTDMSNTTNPYSQWNELIVLAYQPMGLASFAGLFSSVFLGRWQAVSVVFKMATKLIFSREG